MLKRLLPVFVFAALILAAPSSSPAQSQPNWVGTWAAAPVLADGTILMRPLSGATLREIVHVSIGGSQVRFRFTNEFGLDPLTVADAHVAVSAGGSAIQPGTDHPITFGGSNSVNIPQGAAIWSDPVSFNLAPLSEVAVSFYLPPQVMRAQTYHQAAAQDNFFVQGDQSTATDLAQASTVISWYYFDGIDVAAPAGARSIVAFGDSITDGTASTRNGNHRWPNYLAARLQADPKLKNVGVLDVGIGGNRVLNEGNGPSLISRIDRDILAQSGVKYVIVLESINDIGRLASRQMGPTDNITAEQLEWGVKQLIDAAHQRGIKVFGATLTPYGGAGYFSDKGEQVREAYNNWIRTSGAFDGVFDFDKATQDPQNPTHFNAAYDSGDHLHPQDAGYESMAGSIDLSSFTK